MRVTVRLFAALRDIAGQPEFERDVPAGATAGTVWDQLVAEHPQLGRYTHVVSCAIRQEYSRLTDRLEEGDELAFLPPVSGGSERQHRRRPGFDGPCRAGGSNRQSGIGISTHQSPGHE